MEIDFIASRNDERIYIQIAYLLHDQSTIDREFGALEKIPDNYPKMVLSMDKYFSSNRKGIQWFNLLMFLTQQD